jgi:ABC-type transporter Mla maintaining outer membrane lipid asymmetry ATPase subunit MlaF
VTALYSDQAFGVELRAVTKRFGSLTAVNAVTLKVHKGEFPSLLGPSGCGSPRPGIDTALAAAP